MSILKLSRREFLKVFPINAAGISLRFMNQEKQANNLVGPTDNRKFISEFRNCIPGMKYRMFGKTG